MAAHFLFLPEELILKVCEFLPKRGQAALTQVCQKTHRIATPELYKLGDVRLDNFNHTELEVALNHAAHNNGEGLMLRIIYYNIDTIKGSLRRQHQALTISSKYNFQNAVGTLLEAGISPAISTQEDTFSTPFNAALEAGNTKIARRLLDQGVGVGLEHASNEVKYQLLVLRSDWGRKLLRWGFDVNARDRLGNTLLHTICDHDDPVMQAIRLLLNNGADPNILNNAGETALHFAIKNSASRGIMGPKIVGLMIKHGSHLDSPCNGGSYPIHVACEYGDLATLQMLLKAGVSCNRQDANNNRTAMWSLGQRTQENTEILAGLLVAGINLAIHRGSIEAYLSNAIHQGWMDSLKLLYGEHTAKLDQLHCHDLIFIGGAALGDITLLQVKFVGGLVNVNSNTHGTTALMEACRNQRVEVIEFLLRDAGFTMVDVQNDFFRSAIFEAISEGPESEQIVRYLLPRVRFREEQDINGDTPLQAAIHFRQPTILSLLLDRLVELKYPRAELEAAFSWALLMSVQQNNIGYVRFIINKFKMLRLEVDRHYSPVIEAIGPGYLDIANLLIDEGMAIDHQDRGFTPLMIAIINGRVPIASKLIARGVNIEAMQSNRGTILSLAIEHGQREIVRDLISHGVNVNRLLGIYNPMDDAIEFKQPDILTMLLEAGAKVTVFQLQNAGRSDREDFLQIFLNYAYVNRLHVSGLEPALWQACHFGRVKSVEFLLKNGADAKQPGYHNCCPLTAASTVPGNGSIIKMLLSAGADPNSQTNTGLTALMMAALQGNTDNMALLIWGGANVNCGFGFEKGFPALLGAVTQRNPDSVKLLLAHGAIPQFRIPGIRKGDVEIETLLHRAVRAGVAETVRLLVMAGCDVFARDSLGRTPLQLEEAEMNDDIVAALYHGHPASRG